MSQNDQNDSQAPDTNVEKVEGDVNVNPPADAPSEEASPEESGDTSGDISGDEAQQDTGAASE